ncbi:hypothetical protein ABT352_23530 [Streptosporangium sp. NPDC000563]|uniref:PD-(D/E)XK nuclease domain-containing protein n=1 Tax=Streptosporangium sp. NPDC000563 TaxID=3154366 RepID=UPI0033192C61
MPASTNRRTEIEKLIEESYEIERTLAKWQQGDTVDEIELRNGQSQYQAWYSRSLPLIPEATRAEFKDMYEGGMFIKRIKSFIFAPLAINDFYNPAEENPIIDKWKYPYDRNFAESFHTQRSILQGLIYAVAEVAPTLRELAELFSRFPSFLQVLQNSDRLNIPSPTIENEGDLQVLVHACLRLFYEDVRPEDFVPEYGGGRSRVDFLLPEAGIVVETKMTRETLSDKKVGEELLIDWGRYSKHPDCRGIFALVYDPERRLQNPIGLQSDLTQEQNNPATRVLVVR